MKSNCDKCIHGDICEKRSYLSSTEELNGECNQFVYNYNIKTILEPYCDGCVNIDIVSTVTELYAGNVPYISSASITCSSIDTCRNIKKYLERADGI